MCSSFGVENGGCAVGADAKARPQNIRQSGLVDLSASFEKRRNLNAAEVSA
jgi:hypothetical protein